MVFRRKNKDMSVESKPDSKKGSEIHETVPDGIRPTVDENRIYLREKFGDTFDLILHDTEVCGRRAMFAVLDGMYNNLLAVNGVIAPVIDCRKAFSSGDELLDHIRLNIPTECDCKTEFLGEKAVSAITDGCMVLFVDGCESVLAFSVQGYVKAGVQDARREVQENGSREGFTECFKDNVTMVRRRLRTPDLRFETAEVGRTGRTRVCICYHAKRVSPVILNDVRERIDRADIDILPGTGALRPFLDVNGLSFFSAVGETERPDVLAAKLSEGKIGILTDGSPFALVVPYLFTENFHTLDDYLNRPYYATLMRILKIVCFIVAVMLPGMFVAVGTFHQELFPSDVLYGIAVAENVTPFPLVIEALVIHFIYEIVREAGLRMPNVVGHAVSIVGALVIGDAAVTAGLIGAPMLIIIALTAISSSVVSSLYQPVSVLRFIFIVIGGIMGLYGVFIGFGILVCDICSVNVYGIPYSAPFSPFDMKAQKDNIIFAGWKKTGGRISSVTEMNGSETDT